MKVHKLKQILLDSNMQQRDLTVELKQLHTGDNHGGRKNGSKNKMTLAKLATIVEQLAIEMRQGFAQINTRIDNLVAKNNLKE